MAVPRGCGSDNPGRSTAVPRCIVAPGSGRCWRPGIEQLERALDLADGGEGDPGVARRRGDVPAPQPALAHGYWCGNLQPDGVARVAAVPTASRFSMPLRRAKEASGGEQHSLSQAIF